MLKFPVESPIFALIAIDPGLNNIGLSVFKIQVNPFKILSISTETIKSEKLRDRTGLDEEDYSEQIRKRLNIGRVIQAALIEHKPSFFISESPFFDSRKPGSFKILTEVIVTIMDVVATTDPNIKTAFIPPQLAKMVLGVAGQKGKEVVKEAVMKVVDIMDVLEEPFEDLDEHGIDSLAVGYAWLVKKSGLINEQEET